MSVSWTAKFKDQTGHVQDEMAKVSQVLAKLEHIIDEIS